MLSEPLTPEQMEWQKRNRLLFTIARSYLKLLPRWMDLDDLMQEGRLAEFQGRKARWGMISALRGTHRMRRTDQVKRSGLPVWIEPQLESWEELLELAEPAIESPYLSQPPPSPEDTYVALETAQRVVEIAKKTDRRLVPIVTRMAQGFSAREAGEEQGVGKSRVGQINQKLQMQLEEAA